MSHILITSPSTTLGTSLPLKPLEQLLALPQLFPQPLSVLLISLFRIYFLIFFDLLLPANHTYL
jgi:hypothetical protein